MKLRRRLLSLADTRSRLPTASEPRAVPKGTLYEYEQRIAWCMTIRANLHRQNVEPSHVCRCCPRRSACSACPQPQLRLLQRRGGTRSSKCKQLMAAEARVSQPPPAEQFTPWHAVGGVCGMKRAHENTSSGQAVNSVRHARCSVASSAAMFERRWETGVAAAAPSSLRVRLAHLLVLQLQLCAFVCARAEHACQPSNRAAARRTARLSHARA